MDQQNCSSVAAQMASVSSRFSELLWNGLTYDHAFDGKPQIDYARTLVPGDLPDTLCWADINYADQERSGWAAAKHYSRLQNILTAGGKDRLLHDDAYQKAMVAALRYWILHDYKNPNWWHNEIGMPRTMSDLAMMMWDVLPQDLKDGALTLISRGSIKCYSQVDGRKSHLGYQQHRQACAADR